MHVAMENPLSSFEVFLKDHPNVEFVWLQFMSYTANTLVRIVPIAKFKKMLQNNQWLALSSAVFHLSPGDRLVPGASPSGKFYLRPDFSTAYCQFGSNGTRAVVNVDCVNENGNPIPECARSKLRDLHNTLQTENESSLLIGFEIEVMFLQPIYSEKTIVDYEPINSPYQHSFTGMTPEDRPYIELIEAISRALSSVNIELEQFHAEAGPGQWEFVLPPSTPITAIDTLLRARETIMLVAQSYNYRATISTQPFPNQATNGAHIHMSINPTIKSPTQSPPTPKSSTTPLEKAESFFAGIQHHLPAILAFTLPNDASYTRIQTGTWSGGEYAAWGWENKEVSLRRITNERFEIKHVDGFSNPYLVLCALLSAGIIGLRGELVLKGGPCTIPAAQLSDDEREKIGLVDVLPYTLDDILDCLEEDGRIQYLMGPMMVSSYLEVKKGEMEFLRGMGDVQRRLYLISMY